MRTAIIRIGSLLALALTSTFVLAAPPPDSYAGMLYYLTSSQINGHALAGASGVIAANIAAGDLNQQANTRALAVGSHASTQIHLQQQQTGNTANVPTVAAASIGGHALTRASGLVSINQASGVANTELNSASVTLAPQSTQQVSADSWLADVCACEQQTASGGSGQHGTATRLHAAAVNDDAMQGLHGAVQLNQVAGSSNVTANHLSVAVGMGPR